jgi:flagellar FliL protein
MAEKKKEEKKDDGHGEAAAAAKPKSKKKLFIIVGALVVVLAGAGVPMFLMGGEPPKEGEEVVHEEHVESHLEVVPMEVFIVNLSQHTAFIKTRLLLEYDAAIVHKKEEELAKAGHAVGGDAKGGHGPAEGLSGYLKVREPMIRDSVIRVLSSRKPEEVLTADGKERLKEELLETINEAIALDEAPVQQIYFAEFIIQ